MEKWGADLYGNPCRECGFGWKLSPAQAIASVLAVPGAYTSRLAGASGRERHPDLAWTTAAYVSHVTGNLRTWAERLAGGYLAGDLAVPGYDPDLLSRARHYNQVSLAGALWSLRWAVDAWTQAAQAAEEAEAALARAGRVRLLCWRRAPRPHRHRGQRLRPRHQLLRGRAGFRTR